MNKKQTAIYERWLKSDKINLYDCYKHPADDKLNVESIIARQCIALHGKRYRILAYNSYCFTAAFSYENVGKTFLVYHAPYHTEVFEIPPL